VGILSAALGTGLPAFGRQTEEMTLIVHGVAAKLSSPPIEARFPTFVCNNLSFAATNLRNVVVYGKVGNELSFGEGLLRAGRFGD
jgi:hypothetical protein